MDDGGAMDDSGATDESATDRGPVEAGSTAPARRSDTRPPSSRSQTDVVVDEIKAMIISGELKPGSRLPIEKDLAALLGVSRSPCARACGRSR
ncbi:GntR family transcriptional regulator [Rathayibacter oskolensis]|uniref:FadR/GntR family transcriptional regulator n=1 Tax=Rathayibacter oskolensis TaxID=1891671 RepID=UPI00265DCCE6|nr:GntR family transcriptional regulator [Rathayibacter oskolensis]WKK72225.1 GntR family transcriptional regulator [Rathayibacter oskolensis]